MLYLFALSRLIFDFVMLLVTGQYLVLHGRLTRNALMEHFSVLTELCGVVIAGMYYHILWWIIPNVIRDLVFYLWLFTAAGSVMCCRVSAGCAVLCGRMIMSEEQLEQLRHPDQLRRYFRRLLDQTGALGTGSHVRDSMQEPALIHWPPPLDVPEDLQGAQDAPQHFTCPITLLVMVEPAIVPESGHTYDREAILQHCSSVGLFDPTTKQPIQKDRISPNFNLRKAIEDWVLNRMQEERRTLDISRMSTQDFREARSMELRSGTARRRIATPGPPPVAARQVHKRPA